ncbi:uncharacterized protein BKA55DRAFT_535465 [Fusarium redolens]|uniref:DUF7587 domain-containing protein n=1 Tax=Fusarium redolens TaxID=48865 RepID=A0A9P9KKU5_FUSRE|nr:uncharacterized protein BKA55DRAFT_535465 [Fusarium redolens]KAH7265543.1 hypothetical protein BKA55DRAFT_535465 [Fusarium redolens]
MSNHKSKATAEVEDVASKIDSLSITGRKGESQRRKSLNEALRSFNEAAVAFSEQGANIAKLLRADDVFNKEYVESIYLAQTRAIELGRVARLLNDSAIHAVVRQVISLGDKTLFGVAELLQHFKKPIRNIAQRVIGESKSEDILWKIAEECYHQAASPTGELNTEDYLASSKWIEKKDRKQDWIKFWIRPLCKCPGGPTLFQSDEDFVFDDSVEKPPKHMPRYLFRAYDKNSTGLNTDAMVASVLHQRGEANRHKIDIFSMDSQEASEMLHHHLHKGLYNTRKTNNLVSWSSSLMFVIQYANWRFCNPWFGQPDDIHICAVATSKFPRRQFARDKWLLNSFKNGDFSDEESDFRNLRLNLTQYDNGEYLSQGKLLIEGRSCTLV